MTSVNTRWKRIVWTSAATIFALAGILAIKINSEKRNVSHSWKRMRDSQARSIALLIQLMDRDPRIRSDDPMVKQIQYSIRELKQSWLNDAQNGDPFTAPDFQKGMIEFAGLETKVKGVYCYSNEPGDREAVNQLCASFNNTHEAKNNYLISGRTYINFKYKYLPFFSKEMADKLCGSPRGVVQDY